jgi:DNA-binding LacI/PurR family transcriptional regulator
MAITLSQLARELGVSTMTVSRALRGVGRIGEETRTRIVNAAQRHGYRPHGLARAMRSGRSGCVALCVADVPGLCAMPSELAIGIDQALTARGMYLAVARIPDEKPEADAEAFVPRLLGEWVADGMLVSAAHGVPCKVSEQLRQRRVPCVWINAKQELDCVDCDDYDAARRATQRLIQLGHKRIVYANHYESRNNEGPSYAGAQERYEGYESILKEAGLPRRRVWRHPLVSFVEMWRAILTEPANQRPTAVVCFSRYTAHPILQAAGQMSREIPRDLSLVSFDDEPASEFEFPLSTMVLPERQMGQKAVEMLCAKIENPEQSVEGVKLLAEWFDGGTMGAAPRQVGA